MILKGTEVADNVIVAAGPAITKPINSQNVIVGGSPTRIIKEGVTWKI